MQRNLLALRLAPILAVHVRLLAPSENVLWNRVGDLMDGRWRAAQAAAFGIGSEDFRATCEAAIRLYRLAFERVEPVLDDRRRAVVGRVLEAAGP